MKRKTAKRKLTFLPSKLWHKIALALGIGITFIYAVGLYLTVNLIQTFNNSLIRAQALTVTMNVQPAQTTLASNESKVFTLNTNSNGRQISFVRGVLLFDNTKLELVNEIDVTSSPLTQVIEKTSRTVANTNGRAIVVLALAPDSRDNPPTGTIILGNLTFRAKATTLKNVATQITIDSGDVQVVDLQENNLTVNVGNSSITINPDATVTMAPTPTATATPRPSTTPTIRPSATPTPRTTIRPTATPTTPPGGTTPPPSTGLISNLRVANNATYGIATANTGVKVYTDRSYTFNDTLPSSLRGLTLIQTANNDKNSKQIPWISFNANSNITVYIGLDTRVSVPSWMSNFTNTGMAYSFNSVLGQQDRFNVYSRTFSSGPVQLGGNINSDTANSSSRSMYSVFVKAGSTGGGGGGVPTMPPAQTPRPSSAPTLPPSGNIDMSNLAQYCPLYKTFRSTAYRLYGSTYAQALAYLDVLCNAR